MANPRRRALLKSGGVALFAAASGALPLFLPRASAAPARRQKTIVTIFQRFGMDGLLAVAPYADQGLARLRPNLMLSHPGSGKADARLELGDGFGLHPAFKAFKPFYDEGRLAIVHGVGSPDNTRSHTEAQRWWESGAPGDPRCRDGWLNRALAGVDDSQSLLPAVALTQQRPHIFYGARPVTTAADIGTLTIGADSGQYWQQLRELYRSSDHPGLREAAGNGLELSAILARQPAATAAYPEGSQLAASLRDIARLIKADVGLQLAFADSRDSPNGKGTWDTHSNAATVAADGPFPQMAGDLADSLAAFMADLGPRQDDVIVVTLTDFGRNVVENEGLGTDHGRATAMFVLGGSVRGGQVYGSLPERFERDGLEDGMDLPVTTDFRSVLTPLLQQHLGLDRTGVVFPDWQGPSLPILRGLS